MLLERVAQLVLRKGAACQQYKKRLGDGRLDKGLAWGRYAFTAQVCFAFEEQKIADGFVFLASPLPSH